MAKKPSYKELEQRVKELETVVNSPADKTLEQLFNLSLDMLCVADINESRFRLIRKSFEETLGYTKEELLAHPFLHFVHPEDRATTVDAVNRLPDGKPIVHFDNRYQRKDGSCKWLSWTSMPVPGEESTFVVARDITEHKRAEDALRESERKLSTLISSLPGMAYRSANQKDWPLQFASDGALALTGYAPVDFMSQKVVFGELILPDDAKYVWETVQENVRQKRPYILEYRIRTASGQTIWVWERGMGIFSEDDQLLALEGFITDITERKQAEQALHSRQTALNAAANTVVITDAKGTIQWVNPAFTTTTGYSFEEALGKNSRILRSGKQDEAFYKGLWDTILSGQVWQGEFINKRKDGSFYHEEATITPVKDKAGKIVQFIAVTQDVTERKIAEATLEVKTAYLDSILTSSVNMAIAATDLDFRITYYNPTAEEIFGYTAKEVIGKTVMEIHTKENVDPVRFTRAIEIVEREGEYRYKVETEKAGETHYINSRVSGIWNQDRELIGFVLMSEDATRRKQDEAEKDRLQRELKQVQKMEALGQLTGGIAHDFNNILGIVMGYTELARSTSISKGEAKLAEQLNRVLEASERARKLVTQMMAFSRNDVSDDKPLQLQPLVKEDLKLISSTLPSSVEINAEIEEDMPPVLMGPGQLNQLLMNLCVNARDAMEGKGNLTIRLDWAREVDTECATCHKQVEGDWVELSVTDTGSGIQLEELERVFDPFYTTKDVGKGTGLGLSVIQGIMHSHGGHILVETELGKGTIFKLLFPPVVGEGAAETQKADQASSERLQGHGAQILVVDDEPDLGEFIGDLLESHGYQPTIQTSSKKALELFKEKPNVFALVITDQTMPEITGKVLVKNLREVRPDIQVILSTGFSEDIDSEAATKMGIRYLEKPVRAEKLIHAVGELLRPTAQGAE
ncbi:MAG: PAS domain S-box protein [Gammaproteobacteria bacterium]|nr:PAS domain S-box protein [Gammaproteobacteria bacterium]